MKRQRYHDEKLYERETALVRENAREPRDSAVHILRPDTVVHVSPALVAEFRPGVCRPLRRGALGGVVKPPYSMGVSRPVRMSAGQRRFAEATSPR